MNTQTDKKIIVEILKALANGARLNIVTTLQEADEKNVSELEHITGLSQSAVSQHLSRLRRSGLVKSRRDAQTVYYSLNTNSIAPVIESFSKIELGQTS